MSKYNLDLDYAIVGIDVSLEELQEIMDEADSIITKNSESPENLAVAYLKKAQCLIKDHFQLNLYPERMFIDDIPL
jgi:hypothetical protein